MNIISRCLGTVEAVVTVAFLLFLISGAAEGQDKNNNNTIWGPNALCVADRPSGEWNDGHAANHDWYSQLRDHRGVSCCNGDPDHGDCRPVRARQDAHGNWEAFFGGQWRLVPGSAVLDPASNRNPLEAHICAHRLTNYVYCFVPGGGGS